MGNISTKNPSTIECRCFHKAIIRGDIGEIISRIEGSINANTLQNLINAKNKQGYTPLQVAFYEQNLVVFRLLILYGANTNVVNRNGQTLLMQVAEDWLSHNWAQALLESKNTNIRQTTPEGDTALGFAVAEGNAKLVELLCKKMPIRADEKGVDKNPIAISAFEKQKMIPGYAGLPIIQSLITKGANINATDENGNSLLMLAVCDGNHPNLVRFLVAQKNITLTAQNKRGETAAVLAEKNGQHELIALLAKQDELQRIEATFSSRLLPPIAPNVSFFKSGALTKRKISDSDMKPSITHSLN